jgi:hypothetical protein
MNAHKEINRETGWSIALSVLMIVAGMLVIIMPGISGLTVTVLVGWLLVPCGALHLAFAWHRRHGGGLWCGILIEIEEEAGTGSSSKCPRRAEHNGAPDWICREPMVNKLSE